MSSQATQHSYESESRSTIIQHVYSLTVTVQKNYMFSEFARKTQISLQKKKKSYNLQNFNETLMKYNNKLIDQKIQLIHLKLEHH